MIITNCDRCVKFQREIASKDAEIAKLKEEVEIGKQICGNAMGVIAELQNIIANNKKKQVK